MRSDGATTEFEIIFNTNFTWNAYDGPLRQAGGGGILNDVRRILLHELGHAQGLDHPEEYGQSVTAIMNGHESDLYTLTSDDRNGVIALYGSPQTGSPTPLLSQTALTFTGQQGGVNPPAQTITVNNSGGGRLTFVTTASTNRFSISPSSGVAPASFVVTADLSGLQQGNYNGSVQIWGAGSNNTPSIVSVTFNVQAGAPTLSGIAPNSATAGSSDTTIVMTGSNFSSTSVATMGGIPLVTTFVDSSRLSAVVSLTALSNAGTFAIAVVNPAPGGTSSAISFTVMNPNPLLSRIDPSVLDVGSGDARITATGTGFTRGSTVRITPFGSTASIDLQTTFVSATSLTAIVPVTRLTTTGSLAVAVFNPAPGGGSSSTQFVSIVNPIPSLASIGPRVVLAGTPGFFLTVNGTNFVSGSKIRVNGSDRTTTFVSTTRLLASIPATDLVSVQSLNVTVFNPEPGGTSASQSLTVMSTTDPTSSLPFVVPPRAGMSLKTDGGAEAISVGYARIQADSGLTAPSGMAIFGLRQNGILVTEASTPATRSIKAGRIYAEINGGINTGLAVVNPNSQVATLSFFFTDSDGRDFGKDSTIIPANGQIAKFLNEAPFNGGSSLNGTLTFTSSLPVSVIALRGLINERSEFLVTTLPVSELSAPIGQTVLFPHFADGGGWATELVLVNSTDENMNGTIQFFDQGSAGATQLLTLMVNDGLDSSFAYSIPPRSSRQFQTKGQLPLVHVGSIRVVPAPSTRTPSGLGIFSFKNSAGITVSAAGVPSTSSGSAFRMYVEAAQADSIQSGIAIANASAASTTVNFELTNLDGSLTGLTGAATLAGYGQLTTLLNQIRGFENLPQNFRGILRISTASVFASGISIVGLRARYNERGDFLISTTSPLNESEATVPELIFPHFVDGGGYTTQFILYGSSTTQYSGNLSFFAQDGQSFSLRLPGTP